MATLLYILPSLLALAAMVMTFTRRWPAPAVAFVAMLAARWLGWGQFMPGTLWFWGATAAIVTATHYLSELPPLPALRYYTVGGALVGSVIGALFSTMAGLIAGGIVGAALGFIAFRRTPDGRMNATVAQTLSVFADTALPACVAFFISIMTLAQLPLFR